MKHTRTTAFAAMGLVAVLSLTACGNDDSKKDSSAKSASSSSSSSDKGSASSGDAKTGDVTSDSGKDTSSRAASGNGSASAKKGKFCRTADLAMDAKDTSPDAQTGDVTVTMVNRGSKTCSATGFPGLDIKDSDHTSSPIERANNQPRITSLKPGDAASFNVSFKLAANGEGAAKPTQLQVTPPNETHTVNIKWPSGELATPYADDSVKVHPVAIATN